MPASFGPKTLAALRAPVLLEHALCDVHASHLRFFPRLHRRVWHSHLWWVKPDPYWYHQLHPIGLWPRWGSLKLLDEVAFPSLVRVLSSRPAVPTMVSWYFCFVLATELHATLTRSHPCAPRLSPPNVASTALHALPLLPS